jgi:phospholipase C
MSFRTLLKRTTGLLGALAILSSSHSLSFAQSAPFLQEDFWPQHGIIYGGGWLSGGGHEGLSLNEKVELLRRKVKYVFVIFHENESFDHYFGTFPGANGLFTAPPGATPANKTPSFVQKYLDTTLKTVTISPFLTPQAVTTAGGQIVPIYPADQISVDHSHTGISNDLDVDSSTGVAANDRYAMDQEKLTTNTSGDIVNAAGAAPTSISLAAKQTAEADVGHLDCDTIPFMWSWAKHFVLFDNFHQTIVGPSTPNALAIIAGQSGETQWALHPNETATTTYANSSFPNPLGATYAATTPPAAGDTNGYVPLVNDAGPLPGSNLDNSKVKPPYNFDESATNPAPDLTFATQPLSFMGKNIKNIIQTDQNPTVDLADVQKDIKTIAAFNAPVNWGWYQQGFNANDTSDPYEPQNTATPNPTNNPGLNTGYVLHHNAPQYFGYLADNPQVLNNNFHGAKDFFQAVEGRKLPYSGGVFYLRGGYDNNDGLVPVDPTAAIQHAFIGNDDHASYSDHQISEALAAKAINDIAISPYWSESAIIITYDETDGLYDHVAPELRTKFVDGSPLEAGPRIPAIVISPYAKAGKISHRYSEHGSVIKFINALFGLVPLAALPNEVAGRQMGLAKLGQADLEPSDDPQNNVGDLLEAFDEDALLGVKSPIPAYQATFPADVVATLPHLARSNYSPNGYTNGACAAIGVLPTDFPSVDAYKKGQPIDPYPVDVNPRPTQSPGTPTSGIWTP